MTTLTEIGTYVAATHALTVATNLFLGQLPDDPDDAVGIFVGQAGEPEFTMTADSNTPQAPVWEPWRVQIQVRKGAALQTAYPDAEALAYAIYRSLILADATLSGKRYVAIEPQGVPFPMEEDKRGRMVFAVNFIASREP